MTKLSHIDEQGRARMVDVSDKDVTRRIAVARGAINMRPETLALILEEKIEKGDVFSVARVAGIMAAKKDFGANSDVPSAKHHFGGNQLKSARKSSARRNRSGRARRWQDRRRDGSHDCGMRGWADNLRYV